MATSYKQYLVHARRQGREGMGIVVKRLTIAADARVGVSR